ncbi:PLAC8-like protein 1 isoform X1 [Kryptolebias marmoratus]|uniref:Plac8 onzin related protein 1 n=1 Tax=Kryptolebias marmoratus TaxID=37003 RepID=A0A3Q3EN02_KRYMA|nr:PLAC8-like protein 1 isoform X1 [Kryptolebias marmoratus]XP_037832590.1 PLAC8-like protein 1 isoform X1 [Kryptolebias marmoratus]XP_037832591.1 PLAC8-like protein 1 isoform X1 [Kryptolebias marmoratus]
MSRHVILDQPKSRPEEAGEWSTGLCECYKDVGDCCLACCCLPVFTCQVSRSVGAFPCLPLLDWISCVPPASVAMRASVRERYNIQGSAWSDCVYGCCCYRLSWLQISRELKRRASSSSSSSRRYTALTSLQGAHLV